MRMLVRLHTPPVRLNWLLALTISVSAWTSTLSLAGQPAPVPAAEATSAQPSEVAAEPTPEAEIPPARTHYFGRRIAPYMTYHGADWLLRETREDEERTSELLKVLDIQPGQTVCDLGCGNGYFTLEMAKQVGPGGQVYAVDIQPEMLSLLNQRLRKAGIKNVQPVLGSIVDPQLPEGELDLVLVVDVYHEFSHPEQMLQNIRRALKPTGCLVLVEYRAEDPRVPIKPLHKMSKRQIHRELTPNGYKLVRQYDELPWQHVMFYGPAEEGEDPADDARSAD